jgi:RNA-directed DNA polymerase
VHHAVMNVLDPHFVSTFISHTYSCIKGKGIHAAANAVRAALRNQSETTYCLKMDIRKFYPSVDHDILKSLLRRKFKDDQLLSLLDSIIDSAPGLPIGNYLSQYFANFYLSYFDHWVKEDLRVKYYFRYADDLVILSHDKKNLHNLKSTIEAYLHQYLKLQLKSNWQVFPVKDRGIDFVGYVFKHTHTRLRKSIKKNMARKAAKGMNNQQKASYMGWLKHCDSYNLKNKLFNEHI